MSDVAPVSTKKLGFEMFLISFTALFLEMMIIRWVPSVVHLVAYYANLMLLSSFLGLGAGAMMAKKSWNLFSKFPLFLAVQIGALILCHNAVLGSSITEARFFQLAPSTFNGLILILIFATNAAVFIPLGQRMGILFNELPRLYAYTWDLMGSLCGTLCFGLFSLKLFSPTLGLALVMLIYAIISRGKHWITTLGIFTVVIFAILWEQDPNAIWSPYYYITVVDTTKPDHSVSTPPSDLLTMRDPPIYGVNVNQFGYHFDAAFNSSRYTPDTAKAQLVNSFWVQYHLPYVITTNHEKILIVGAGGGSDVEAGLDSGAKHIDAVEIDRAIINISKKFNAGAPYADPKVTIHINDARSYLANATPGYDLVVFGFLDSQALFSSMNNVRLDGYVYTVESIRTAYKLLNNHGMLSLSFFLGRQWLGPKLYELVAAATGRTPVMYLDGTGQRLVLCVTKDGRSLPTHVNQMTQTVYTTLPKIDLPTDDWPFLYLIRKTIPTDYLIAISSLLCFSLITLGLLRRSSFGSNDVHFGLLGAGFLLLETKNITDCTLLFGATWFVTLIVIVGILLMVLLANAVTHYLKTFSFWLYVPLFLTLLVLLLVPRESVLQFSLLGKLLWTLGIIPLPIFFAGIIFSSTFRSVQNPAAVFGSNLIGAMIGGFCEYLGMAIGNHQLSLLVILAYLGSLLVLLVSRRHTPLS